MVERKYFATEERSKWGALFSFVPVRLVRLSVLGDSLIALSVLRKAKELRIANLTSIKLEGLFLGSTNYWTFSSNCERRCFSVYSWRALKSELLEAGWISTFDSEGAENFILEKLS